MDGFKYGDRSVAVDGNVAVEGNDSFLFLGKTGECDTEEQKYDCDSGNVSQGVTSSGWKNIVAFPVACSTSAVESIISCSIDDFATMRFGLVATGDRGHHGRTTGNRRNRHVYY